MSRLALLLLSLLLTVGLADSATAGGDWNDSEIKWLSYEDGLAAAKKSKKPMLLVFYTDWCPHCTNYSKVFHDPKVVAKAKELVMVRVNADQDKPLGQKYAVDGSYIPRTYFLGPDGTLSDIHAPREQFKYFYDERNPGSILAGMDAAVKKYD